MNSKEATFRVTYVGDSGRIVRDERLPAHERFLFPSQGRLEPGLRGAIERELGERKAALQQLYRELVLSNFTKLDGASGQTARSQLDRVYPDTGSLPDFIRVSGAFNTAGAIFHNAKHRSGRGYQYLPSILEGLVANRVLDPPRCPGDSPASPPKVIEAHAATESAAPNLEIPMKPAIPPRPPTPMRPPSRRASPASEMMQQPEPQSRTFKSLMNDVETGAIKIPQFQREFVWTPEKSAKLLDSILKGYPIGTFIFWKTKERLRTVKNIGGAALPDAPEGDFVQHVLDGQQRLTSLYASVHGLPVARGDHTDDFGHIYADLEATEDQDIVVTDVSGRAPGTFIRIVDLIDGELTFLTEFPKEFHQRLSAYKDRVTGYSFSIVLVKEAPIDVATEIFTRINVTGKSLSVFEIMVAKTFDSGGGFDLAEEVEKVTDRLRDVEYETIRPETMLQAVSVILEGECHTKHILKLPKDRFIQAGPRVIDSLYDAVEYFRGYYRVPAARLLPFAPLLVPFTYYFYHHPARPAGDQKRYLEDFFWRVSLTGRYSSSLESKLGQDVKRIDEILAGGAAEIDSGVDISPEFIRANGYFRTGRSYTKALLCLLAYHQPRSFSDGSPVRISNDWLKQANSKNYHHFFPRAFLRRQGFDDADANHVANITIVDDYLNKRVIRDRPPSEYLAEFRRENGHFRQTMASHLIDLEASGALEDNYEQFLQARCEAFSAELATRIIQRDVDRMGQGAVEDDSIEESD